MAAEVLGGPDSLGTGRRCSVSRCCSGLDRRGPISPRQRQLELSSEPDEQRLTVERRDELDAERQASAVQCNGSEIAGRPVRLASCVYGIQPKVLVHHVVDDLGVAQQACSAGLDQHIGRMLQRDGQVELTDLGRWGRQRRREQQVVRLEVRGQPTRVFVTPLDGVHVVDAARRATECRHDERVPLEGLVARPRQPLGFGKFPGGVDEPRQ